MNMAKKKIGYCSLILLLLLPTLKVEHAYAEDQFFRITIDWFYALAGGGSTSAYISVLSNPGGGYDGITGNFILSNNIQIALALYAKSNGANCLISLAAPPVTGDIVKALICPFQ